MVHDYVRFRMTGEVGAEVTNISGSNFYNISTGKYDNFLLENFDLAECADKLAKVVQSAEHCGNVTAEVADLLGVPAGTPVFGGFFDVVASAVSTGVIDDTAISVAAGT